MVTEELRNMVKSMSDADVLDLLDLVSDEVKGRSSLVGSAVDDNGLTEAGVMAVVEALSGIGDTLNGIGESLKGRG